jgi:hypothetical protein
VSAGFRGGNMHIIKASISSYGDGLLKLNCPYIPGMSGGACFDSRGRLVAVVVASDMRTFGVSCDGPRLHDMVDKYRRERDYVTY